MQYGFQEINQAKYYFDKWTGAMAKGLQTIANAKYLFGNDGKMQTGQRNLGGYWYNFDQVTGKMSTGLTYLPDQNKKVYYNAQGQMQYGQQNVGGHWYLFDKVTGAMKTGFQYIADQHKTVYYNKDGQMLYGFQKVGGATYYFDPALGTKATGQKNINGHWYYFNGSGVMATGFTYLPDQNKKVYYNDQGQMQYGFQKIKGKTYYLDPVTGSLTKGQRNINNHWYNFNLKTGELSLGLTYLPDEKKTVYYNEVGQMLYGSQTIAGVKYYFDLKTGAMKQDELVYDPKTKKLSYYAKDGKQVTGSVTLNKQSYDFTNGYLKVANKQLVTLKNKTYLVNGAQVITGQQQFNNHWYYFSPSTGEMATGLTYLPDQKKTVYYNQAGQMQYGQQNISGHWYLFDGVTGAMKTGLQWIGSQNKTVYYAGNGQMQYGQQNIGGHWYLFDSVTGAMKTGFQSITAQNKTVYYNKAGQMQYGRQYIDGHWYYFDTNTGNMQRGWRQDGRDWYYYNTGNGQMQTGTATINGVTYKFDGNGKQILNYSIDYRYSLPNGAGENATASNKYLILHDVGVETGAAVNASYFYHNYNKVGTYVTFVVGDGGKVYQVSKPGQVSHGAGYVANHDAPVQIELGRTWNGGQFWKDYITYIRLARDMAGKYGIPLTLDAGGAGTPGIKAHVWVTRNIWGDHVDPYGYLARFGVTKDKLAHDLLYGI